MERPLRNQHYEPSTTTGVTSISMPRLIMENMTPKSFEELSSRTRSYLTKLQHRDHINRWWYHQAEIELIES